MLDMGKHIMSKKWEIDLIRTSFSQYCVRYPHANPFLRNEITWALTKCPKFGKSRGKNL